MPAGRLLLKPRGLVQQECARRRPRLQHLPLVGNEQQGNEAERYWAQ